LILTMKMKLLYGIYGEHTQQACPLYNKEVREYLLSRATDMEKNAQKYGVKVLHQFHSGLEHTFLWVMEADNAHSIEDLMARTAGRFNTIRIVPLTTFQGVIERCKSIEDGTFFA
jgi:uncharacterized protein with GYD domain